MGDLGILLVVVLLLVLLLRPRALPELGRALGETLRGVRKAARDDDERGDDERGEGAPPSAR